MAVEPELLGSPDEAARLRRILETSEVHGQPLLERLDLVEDPRIRLTNSDEAILVD